MKSHTEINDLAAIEALPENTVILDRDGCAMQRDSEYWRLAGFGDALGDYEVRLPAIVLCEPERDHTMWCRGGDHAGPCRRGVATGTEAP